MNYNPYKLIIKLFVYTCLAQIGYSQTLDYTGENLIHCHSSDFTNELDEMNMFIIDKYIFIIGGPIGIITTASVIICTLKYPKLRQCPGDIFIGTAFAEFLLVLHWFSFPIYDYINNQPVVSKSLFCQFNAFIGILAGTLELFYNCSYFGYLIIMMKNSLKSYDMVLRMIHLIVISVALLFTGIQFPLNQVGKNSYATCSFKASSQLPLSGILIFIFYLTFSYSTLLYLKHKMPEFHKINLQNLKTNYLSFSKTYLWSCIIIWSILLTSNILVYLNCELIQSPGLNLAVTIGNLSKVATAIVLPLIRLSDPNIKSIFSSIKKANQEKLLQNSINQMENSINLELNNTMHLQKLDQLQQEKIVKQQIDLIIGGQDNMIVDTQSITNQDEQQQRGQEISDVTQKRSAMRSKKKPSYKKQNLNISTNEEEDKKEIKNNKEEQKVDEVSVETVKKKILQFNMEDLQEKENKPTNKGQEEPEYIREKSLSIDQQDITAANLLFQNIKKGIVYRIISGILLQHKRKRQLFNIEIQNLQYKEGVYQDKKIYTIRDDLVNQFFDNILKNINIREEQYKIKMTAICPLIFQQFIAQEQDLNIEESLNLELNKKQIQQSCQININDQIGSEYLQFQSMDQKIIVKTITFKQYDTLIKSLESYYLYIKQNPKSLIAKIYGIYIFEGFDDEQYYVLVMQNVSFSGTDLLNRRYNLKGSTYDREVLDSNPNANLDQITLKDIDFLKIEKHVYISQKEKEQLIAQIKKDVDFLQSNHFFDYSLIITKIERKKNSISNPQFNLFEAKKGENTSENIINIVECTANSNYYYKFGITNFMQKYDCSFSFKKTKQRILKLNRKLDTTIQKPEKYKERFLRFIDSIIDTNQDNNN